MVVVALFAFLTASNPVFAYGHATKNDTSTPRSPFSGARCLSLVGIPSALAISISIAINLWFQHHQTHQIKVPVTTALSLTSLESSKHLWVRIIIIFFCIFCPVVALVSFYVGRKTAHDDDSVEESKNSKTERKLTKRKDRKSPNGHFSVAPNPSKFSKSIRASKSKRTKHLSHQSSIDLDIPVAVPKAVPSKSHSSGRLSEPSCISTITTAEDEVKLETSSSALDNSPQSTIDQSPGLQSNGLISSTKSGKSLVGRPPSTATNSTSGGFDIIGTSQSEGATERNQYPISPASQIISPMSTRLSSQPAKKFPSTVCSSSDRADAEQRPAVDTNST